MRAAFMVYVTGSIEAVDFYSKAFSSVPRNCFKASCEDDFYIHAEVVINDHVILGISERSCYDYPFTEGNNMQFWVSFDNEPSVMRAYEVLSVAGTVHYLPTPCDWCPLMTDITDRYGIRWLLNVF